MATGTSLNTENANPVGIDINTARQGYHANAEQRREAQADHLNT